MEKSFPEVRLQQQQQQQFRKPQSSSATDAARCKEGKTSQVFDHNEALHIRLINAYIDWRDFEIRTWDRSLPGKEIPSYWKDALRSFRRLENEAQKKKMDELREAMMKGKPSNQWTKVNEAVDEGNWSKL